MSLRILRLILWARLVSARAELAAVRKQSRLMLAVLVGFCVGYLGVGYILFHAGLVFLHGFPLIGSLLAERILYLIFGFFFAMLIFSNAIIGYAGLFKNRETNFLLSLPISARDVYIWKLLESFVLASWALLFLSAPLMIAWGQANDARAPFYFEVFIAFIPFVILPAQLGSWAILILVRVLDMRWAKRILAATAAGIILWIAFAFKPVADTASSSIDALTFYSLLRRTNLSLSPALPSSWMAQVVLAWTGGLFHKGAFFFLVLLSNALLGLVISSQFAGRLFYGSWSAAMASRAERTQRRFFRMRRKTDRPPRIETLIRFLPFSRPVKALALKDARLFSRDPAQWTQFLIFFGLLCIYVLNLRNVPIDYQSPFWEALVSYLNLAASTLTLSTLTTRFVFPQFSLEGRRLWIIGLSPIGMRKVLLQKFAFSCSAMLVTVALMTASSMMLKLPWDRVLFFDIAIALPAAALCGSAVGLGALFPNLKEDNPSKIVSGFGGTLCLIVSFVYIVVYVSLIAIPGLRKVTHIAFIIPDFLALSLAFLCSLAVLCVPLFLSIRRVKNLEF